MKCQSIEFHDVQNAKTVVISVINECQKYMREQKVCPSYSNETSHY